MPQSGCSQIEATLPIRKRSYNPGATADLFHDAFQGVVGPDLNPMTVWKGVVGEGWIQISSATLIDLAKASIGVRNPRHLRGVVLYGHVMSSIS